MSKSLKISALSIGAIFGSTIGPQNQGNIGFFPEQKPRGPTFGATMPREPGAGDHLPGWLPPEMLLAASTLPRDRPEPDRPQPSEDGPVDVALAAAADRC